MKICALEGCNNPIPKGNGKYCCQEHYWEWLRQGNAPCYWQGKKRPNVGKKIAAKLKGRENTALKGRKFPDRVNSGQFEPGLTPWNKGQEMTQEYCENIKQAMREHNAIRYGPDNSSWKGGISPANAKLRKSERYKEWREKVFERDNYTCQICGQVGYKLVAHHIKRWADHPSLRFDVRNGITMCRPCHSSLHSQGYNDKGEITKVIKRIFRVLSARVET